MPEEIRRKMDSILLARQYNRITNSSITHVDVESWGIIEFGLIETALNLMQEI